MFLINYSKQKASYITVTSPEKFELHLTVEQQGQTCVEMIKQACSLSSQQIKQAIQKGALWHSRDKSTQRLRRLKRALKPADQLHFYYDIKVLAQKVSEAVLIEDFQQYSVWYKPYGMLCQGSKWSDHCTITRFVEHYFNNERPAFLVHRLDRAASGLIIIAHSKKVAGAFSRIFENRQLEKYYQIICHGELNADSNLEVTEPIDNKNAKSTFTQLEYLANSDTSLIEVKIETGRKHQIRKHAAFSHLPVVGDRLHGDKSITYPESLNLQLCAVKLSFQCPVSNKLKVIELNEKLTPQLNKVAELLNKEVNVKY